MRVAAVAALILSPWFAQAAPRQRLTVRLPDLPEIDLSEMELPEIDVQILADVPQIVASEEGDEDQDSDEGTDEHKHPGVHVYKMRPEQHIRIPRIHNGWGHEEWNEGNWWSDATAKANGRGSATLPVKGPVNFQLHAQSGDIDVVCTDKAQVAISVSDAPPEDVALYAFGDRVEASFRGRRSLRRGKLRVELPKGSKLDLSSMSGDVTAQKLGEVRIRTMSGDVKLSSVGKADVQTISGDVRIDDAAGPVRLHTVSGHGIVNTAGAAPQVEYQSASGNLDWSGLCAKDCHLSAETVSGDLRLAVDPKSSFELSYTSHSGEMRDEAELSVKRSPKRRRGMSGGWLEATYGKGEGVIEADAFSGSLTVKKK
jgi:hypothetical protein